MFCAVETYSMLILLVVSLPPLNGKPEDNNEFVQSLDFEKNKILDKDIFEIKTEVEYEPKHRKNIQGSREFASNQQLQTKVPETNSIITSEDKLQMENKIQFLREMSAREGVLMNSELWPNSKRGKRFKIVDHFETSTHESQRTEVIHPIQIEIKDTPPQSHGNYLSVLWKRQGPALSKDTSKPDKGRLKWKESHLLSDPISKLKNGIHQISETLVKVKQKVHLPTALSRSWTYVKRPSTGGVQRCKSVRNGSDQPTSGNTKKPTGTGRILSHEDSVDGFSTPSYKVQSNDLILTNQPDGSQPPRQTTRDRDQNASYDKGPFPSPKKVEDHGELWDFIDRHNEKWSIPEVPESSSSPKKDSSPSKPIPLEQVPGSPRAQSNTSGGNQDVKPPDSPSLQRPPFPTNFHGSRQQELNSQENQGIVDFINCRKNIRTTDDNDNSQPAPSSPQSPRNRRSPNGSPNRSPTSSPNRSPPRTTSNPDQLRKKPSKEINN